MEPLIRQKADWQTATNAEIRAFFQKATATPIATKWTYGEAVDTICARLVSAGDVDAGTKSQAYVGRLAKSMRTAAPTDELMDSLYVAFRTLPGIRLDTAERQTMLDTFSAAGSWPAATLTQLKALGIRLSTMWVDYYDAAPLPTLQQIGDAVGKMKHADRCEEAKVILSSPNRDNKTFAELRAEIGAL